MTFNTLLNIKGRRGNGVPKVLKKIFFNHVARILRIKLESVMSRKVLNNRLSYETNRNGTSNSNSLINISKSNNMCNQVLNGKNIQLILNPIFYFESYCYSFIS